MEKFGMISGSPWKSFIASVNECRDKIQSALDSDENSFGMHMHTIKPSSFPFLQETFQLKSNDEKKKKRSKCPKQVIVLGSIARNKGPVVEQAVSWLNRRYKTVIISEGFDCKTNCLVSGEGNIADRLINARASDGQFHLNEEFDVFILPNYGKLVREELLTLKRFRLAEVYISAGYQIFPDIHMLAILGHGKLLP